MARILEIHNILRVKRYKDEQGLSFREIQVKMNGKDLKTLWRWYHTDITNKVTVGIKSK